MEMREYMWKHKKKAVTLAKDAGCSTNSIGKIKRKTTTPGLLLALKLVASSSYEIHLESLLNEADGLQFEAWCCKNNIHNL